MLEACDGTEALGIAHRHQGTIHLLCTDVVMPVVGGRELAEKMALLRPDTKVLFMSGYTDSAVTARGVLEPGIFLLQKPFTLDALTRKVREVLDTRVSVNV